MGHTQHEPPKEPLLLIVWLVEVDGLNNLFV